MKHYVYVIVNKKGLLYKGVTSDVVKRIHEHNHGKNSWTRSRGPWNLLYVEDYDMRCEALRRERFLKSGKGREFLKKVVKIGKIGE